MRILAIMALGASLTACAAPAPSDAQLHAAYMAEYSGVTGEYIGRCLRKPIDTEWCDAVDAALGEPLSDAELEAVR